MLAYLEDKREELLAEIAECEKELEEAKTKLEFLDEIIADVQEDAEEEETEAATEVNNGTVALYP